MNQEMVKAEKRFANHKARLDILDENVRVLNWRQPGTQAYAIRAVMDGYHVYITGDLGSAVICLTETATLKALSGYWKKPGYFMEKFVCTTDDYFFDYETAKGGKSRCLLRMAGDGRGRRGDRPVYGTNHRTPHLAVAGRVQDGL